jgi:putative DNA primase/helicase
LDLGVDAFARGGRIDELRQFLNVEYDTWALVVAWLIAAFCPRGPYPILALFAEQGSGRSTMGRLLRDLVDPNSAPLRAEPGDERDLMITANNSWRLAYDNLSHVPPWLSDASRRTRMGSHRIAPAKAIGRPGG